MAWLKTNADAATLDIQPPFQRNPVWLTPQKSALIDTILRAYPIPELYMQDIVDERGRERHVVVDGQQRIRACLEFVENDFRLDGKNAPQLEGLSFDDLPTEVKQRIFKYKFVVRLLPEMPEEEIRGIFARLNRNVLALNAQELRHATYWGDFIACVETLAEDTYWPTAGVFTPNDVRRMLDVEFISEIAIAYLHGLQNKKDTLEQWYAAYEEGFERRSEIEGVFRTVMGELSQVLPDISRTRWSKRSDYYSLFLVFSRHHQSLPLTRGGRAMARAILIRLADDVDAVISDSERPSESEVKRYVSAVGRAASDLGTRRARQEILEHMLEPVWAEGPAADEVATE